MDPKIVEKIYTDFLTWKLINHKCGGIAARHHDAIYYVSKKLNKNPEELYSKIGLTEKYKDEACAGLWKKLFDDGATVIAHTVTSNGRCIDELFPREHTIPCHDLKVIKIMTGSDAIEYELQIVEDANWKSDIEKFEKPSHAVLVRSHGLFVWGKDLTKVVHQIETLEGWFEDLYARRLIKQ